MADNLFETQYDITKKSKLIKLYEENKFLLFTFILILIIILGSFSFYLANKAKQKTLVSENYIKAKIFLENKNQAEAVRILKDAIYADDSIYSPLSFFLLLDKKLIKDDQELSNLFNQILANDELDKELKDLLTYKKSLFNSAFVQESILLEEVKPLLNGENLWKPHALLLLGDYFASKNEFKKAQEFYIQIFSLKNINKDLYDETRSRLALIKND
tara:strand:+ start:1098 stop:1745 length:648 start_codon:yes stop_codon:yes gene_type:complete